MNTLDLDSVLDGDAYHCIGIFQSHHGSVPMFMFMLSPRRLKSVTGFVVGLARDSITCGFLYHFKRPYPPISSRLKGATEGMMPYTWPSCIHLYSSGQENKLQGTSTMDMVFEGLIEDTRSFVYYIFFG